MRTFSLVEGTSDKFWHIDVADTSVTVHYGRTGTAGQRNTKEFATAAKADEHATKQIAAKVAKGYVEGAASAEGIEPTAVRVTQPKPDTSAPSAPPATPPAAATAAAPVDTSPTTDLSAVPANADGLGMLMPQLVRDTINGEIPAGMVTPTRDPRPFKPAAEGAWVQANTVEGADPYRRSWTFTDLPFDTVPTDDPERALWWDWWAQGREPKSWGGTMPMPTRSRNKFASDRVAEEPAGSSAPLDRWGDDDLLVTVAARLAVTDADRTLWAASRQDQELSPVPYPEFIPALRALVVPHLSPDLRALLAQDPPSEPPGTEDRSGYVHADLTRWALLGETEKLLAGIRENSGSPALHLTSLLWAVPDVATRLELVTQERHWCDAEGMRDLLWLLGVEALPVIRDQFATRMSDTPREETEKYVEVLGTLLHGPAAVDLFLELALTSKARGRAREWLVAHADAVNAWAQDHPTAPSARVRDLLEGIVREIRTHSPGTFTSESAGFIGEVVTAIEAEENLPVLGADGSLPDWWTEAWAADTATEVLTGPIKVPAKVPAFAQPGSLPPISLDGTRLSPEQTAAVLLSAARGSGDPELAARPLVAAVRDRMAPHSRDTLATALLEGFLGTGAKSPDRAWFMAAGFLGHDGFALHLAPLVRAWPGESQHHRAVLGLDVLAATGTDTALGVISGIANKSKFKGVQKAARESLTKLAAIKGLTVGQLEDRVVPDGGLDERGHREFSYGPRSFRVSLTPAGKLQVRDLDAESRPTGKPRTALPAANSKDDAELVEAAKADFKVLRKTVTDLAKVQTTRLEQAMVSSRSWTGAEHEQFLARHPILNSLVRPLVWSVTDTDGTHTLVRVTDEHTYLTIEDDDFVMPEEAVVKLAHRISLTDADAAAWRQHLVDYDLVSPVEQLERATFGLPEGQQGPQLAGVPTGTVNPLSLVGVLERLGWRRGIPADAGVVNYLCLTFSSLGLAAVIEVSDGLWTGMIGESGDQRLGQVLIGPADQVNNMWYVSERNQTWLDWTQVDPLVVSETRRSLAAVEEKMQ